VFSAAENLAPPSLLKILFSSSLFFSSLLPLFFAHVEQNNKTHVLGHEALAADDARRGSGAVRCGGDDDGRASRSLSLAQARRGNSNGGGLGRRSGGDSSCGPRREDAAPRLEQQGGHRGNDERRRKRRRREPEKVRAKRRFVEGSTSRSRQEIFHSFCFSSALVRSVHPRAPWTQSLSFASFPPSTKLMQAPHAWCCQESHRRAGWGRRWAGERAFCFA